MKKAIFVGFILSIMSGCTTVQYPRQNSFRSTIEQRLEWQAFESVASGIIAYDTNRIEQMRKEMDFRQQELRFTNSPRRQVKIRRQIDTLTRRLNDLSDLKVILKHLETAKLYLDLQSDEMRQYIYRHLILNSLRSRNISLTLDEKEANYTLHVLVKEDGIDQQMFNFFYIFWSSELMGTAIADVNLVDLKTNEVVYKDTVRGDSYYLMQYFLGILGPLHSTSLR